MRKKFRTRDIGEAAAILASGVEFFGLEQGKGFYWFVFNREKATEVSNNYWSGKFIIAAKTYFDCLRTLKDRLFSQG